MCSDAFMCSDAIGMALGTILLAPFLLAPGYLFGWIFDLLEFRNQSRCWRALLSLVFSVSIAPAVSFLIGALISGGALWTFYAAACAFAIAAELSRQNTLKGRVPRWAVWSAVGWALVVWLSEIELQFGNRLYPSVLVTDFNLRTAFIDGIARHGLPAVNPVFFPGHFVLLRYHYFWFIPIALVDRLGGALVGARQALTGGNVWCGWAMMGTVALYLRFFYPRGERGLASRMKWGIALMAVAGLDILPNIFFDVAHQLTGQWKVYPSAEAWNNPVAPFPHGVLFEAHQYAGLIACATAFLLLWRAQAARYKWASAFCAGLCLASGVGLSIYITFTFAIFLTGWTAVVLFRWGLRAAMPWIASGAVAVAAATPYLITVRNAGGSGGPFVLPTVRSFTIFDTVLPAFGFNWNQIAVANLLVLPLNYFLEAGVWFLLALLWCSRMWRRRRRMTELDRATLVLFAVCFLVGTFLRNGVIITYDLSWRSLLPAQLVLLVWSVDPIRAWRRCRRWARARRRGRRSAPLAVWRFRVAALLALGVASTIYDFVIMRAYLPLNDAGVVPTAKWFYDDRETGKRTFAVRQGYERLRRIAPDNAVFQGNPNFWNDVYHGLYGLRQTASFDYECEAAMGGDPRDCERIQAQLIPLFNDPTASRSIDADKVCDTWGINVLVGKDPDPVFHDRGSWLWTRAALVANDRFRAVPCGSRNPHAESTRSLAGRE